MAVQTPAPERLANLPVWAQDYIHTLERKLKDAEKSELAARLATHPEDTDTVIDRYNEVPIGLPKGQFVRFQAHNLGGWVDVKTEDRGGWVKVMGHRTLEVQPQSSNVVLVRVARDR
jgi:hypothetical protein